MGIGIYIRVLVGYIVGRESLYVEYELYGMMAVSVELGRGFEGRETEYGWNVGKLGSE